MQAERTVEIPQSVLVSAQSLDDLEDWLSANNPEFLGEVRRIRKEEDLAGSGKDLAEVLKRWPMLATTGSCTGFNINWRR